jgi:hypothetical protein
MLHVQFKILKSRYCLVNDWELQSMTTLLMLISCTIIPDPGAKIMKKLVTSMKQHRLAKERRDFEDLAVLAGVDLRKGSPEDTDPILAKKLEKNKRVGSRAMDQVSLKNSVC